MPSQRPEYSELARLAMRTLPLEGFARGLAIWVMWRAATHDRSALVGGFPDRLPHRARL